MPETGRVRPLMVLLVLLFAGTAHSAEDAPASTNAAAALAFGRYTANLEMVTPWNLETVDIEATLTRQDKQGRLRAIRRVQPPSEPQYEVLETAGDRTVKQQVILRYLNADVRASQLSRTSTAVTPANYKFRYQRSVRNGPATIYIFSVSPLRKEEGLIKGQLWLDGETGLVVRQSGYLVRTPSLFLRRVNVTRESTLMNGSVVSRVTYLSVETRLLGRAELIIHEHPGIDSAATPSIEEQ